MIHELLGLIREVIKLKPSIILTVTGEDHFTSYISRCQNTPCELQRLRGKPWWNGGGLQTANAGSSFTARSERHRTVEYFVFVKVYGIGQVTVIRKNKQYNLIFL